MNLNRTFQIVSRILALMGFLSLLQTGEFGPVFWILGLGGISLSTVMVFRNVPGGSGRGGWNILNVFILLYFGFDFFVVSQSLLVSSTHFIIFLMISKLFNLRSPQDHFQLYLISLLQLLAAATFTINLSFLVIFVLYLLAATWALLLHHLVTENREFSGEVVPGINRTGHPIGISWPFFFNTNLIAVAALCCTIVIFFSIPRVSLGFLHQKVSNLIRMSGFSDRVDLGAMGEVIKDSTVVMRVKPDKLFPFREGIYWKGMVFDHYDGTTWRNSFGKGGSLHPGGSRFIQIKQPTDRKRLISQEVILEPVDTPVIFGAPNIVSIEGQFSSVHINALGALSFSDTPATRVSYTVTSQIPVLTRKDAAVISVRMPMEDEDIYLQVPEKMDRIRNLAHEVTLLSQTQLQKVLSIEAFLEKNYRYTLKVKPSLLESPIDDFLFSQKAGFCEHYATSMILMLRTLKIPSRLVTGFLPGEWNGISRHFTVRQSNAHAWVEVWFPGAGWYPFDPTPMIGETSGFGFFARLIDSLQWKWNRYVISYSLKDQIQLASGLKSEIGSIKLKVMRGWKSFIFSAPDFFIEFMTHPVMVMTLVLILGILIVVFLQKRGMFLNWKGLFVLLRGLFAGWSSRASRRSVVRFYARMLEIFRKKGLGKPSSLTPQEFINEVSRSERRFPDLDRGSWARPAMEITGFYYRVRFAGLPLSPAEERRVEDLLGVLKSVKRHS